MTRFKAKLRKIGNSQGIYIPLKVITNYSLGEEIEVEVITKENKKKENVPNVITSKQEVITSKPKRNKKIEWCRKHGSWKITCGCK